MTAPDARIVTADQLRAAWSGFFAERGHTVVPSGSLIPTHPSAPMFTNSGMMPFVPFFLYGSVCVFGFVFIYIFLPETHGKTSEETAKSFHGLRPVVKRTGCKAVCSMCHSGCQCVPLILRKNGRQESEVPPSQIGSTTIATAAAAAAISTMCNAVDPGTTEA